MHHDFSRFYLRYIRLRRVIRRDETDEHSHKAGDEEAERDRQQHPFKPLSGAKLVSRYNTPKAMPESAAATGAVSSAIVHVADGGRLIDGSAVWHVLSQDLPQSFAILPP